MLIATAGHVDHGKTSLIKALTGQDTDRLAEEKRRGLTIELGFAYIDTPAGNRIGFVDVPGHQKFVRNMAAGVAAVDSAMLVVALDDGVMPQTREHIDMLGIFGVRRCHLVLSKDDKNSPDSATSRESRIKSVTEDCRSLLDLHGIALESSFAVSSISGSGIAELLNHLVVEADSRSQESGKNIDSAGDPAGYMFRLAVDRAFTMKGSGTVATGTVYSGCIRVDETVQLLAQGGKSAKCRVKALHVNGQDAQQATQGVRVALNLASINVDDIHKGDWLCSTGQSISTGCIDAQITVLANAPSTLKHWQKVHVHYGSAMTPARISLYDKRSVAAGESAFAQLVLEQDCHSVVGDRMVIRDQNARETLAGAVVLDTYSSRDKSHRKGRHQILEVLSRGTRQSQLEWQLDNTHRPVIYQHYRQMHNLQEDEMQRLLKNTAVTLLQFDSLYQGEKLLLHKRRMDGLLHSLLQGVRHFHQEFNDLRGIETRQLLQSEDSLHAVGELAIAHLISEKRLIRQGKMVAEVGFLPSLKPADQLMLERILPHVGDDNLKPPSLSAIAEQLQIEPSELTQRLLPLEGSGRLLRVAKNRVYHPDAFQALLKIARTLDKNSLDGKTPNEEALDEKAMQSNVGDSDVNIARGFTAKQYRDASGIGRNITIDVLEYMDRQGFTIRLGERRIWQHRDQPLT